MASPAETPQSRENSSLVRQTDLLAPVESKGEFRTLANPASEPGEPFNWFNDETICIEEQPPVAVHGNAWGQVVIRQKATIFGDEDPVIVINRDQLPKLIGALRVWLDI